MRYVRKKAGEFLRYSVALPFSDESHSFAETTPFAELQSKGYFKLVETKPKFDVFTQKINSISITQLNEAEVSLKFTYAPLSKDEQLKRFGKSGQEAKLEKEIKDIKDEIRNALLIGNVGVLEELRGELKELLTQLEILKGEGNEKED